MSTTRGAVTGGTATDTPCCRLLCHVFHCTHFFNSCHFFNCCHFDLRLFRRRPHHRRLRLTPVTCSAGS
ncbi:MAG UNVERIFIED_CONTAM: hypothetical protein LVR18_47285 [Planctomycetaceae bacterium]